MLFMSICRGDLPSALVAYKYILSLSPAQHPHDILRSVIWKASAFHFSALPPEIINVEQNNIWNIISGMCNSCLDKRALSLFLMISNGSNNTKTTAFKKWIERTPLDIKFNTLEDKMIHAAILHLNMGSSNIADDFFSYNATPMEEVPFLSKIEPMYLLGNNSWFYKHIDNSLRIIYNSSNVSNIIYLFEINKIVKKIEYINYWEDAKFSVFGAQSDYIEELWNEKLQPYTETLLMDISQMRLPYGS